jgi:hypothetical protein
MLIVRRTVDLPDPEGPKMTTCSPAWTVRSMPWSTSTFPNDFLIPRSSTTARLCRVAGARSSAWSVTSRIGLSAVVVRIAAAMSGS